MEPEGITRARIKGPWMNRDAGATHSKETISRTMRRRRESFVSGLMDDRHPWFAFAVRHFQLYRLRGIDSRVAGRAEPSFPIAHCAAQAFERNVPQRIGADELPDFVHR